MNTLEILVSIRKIVRSINLESKRIQKDFGLSIPQLLCLGHLSQQPNYQSTHGELMQLLSLNSSTVTGIVNRLEKKGLVARVPKMGDRRITHIVITTNGLKILDKTPDVLHDRLAKSLSKIPQEKQEMVKSALQIIVSAMEIEQLEASPMLTIEDEETVVQDEDKRPNIEK